MTETPPPTRWNPWRELRDHHSEVELVLTDLPDGVDGWTDGRTVWIDRRLSQVQRRCALAHELQHLRRGVVTDSPTEERLCDVLAARELIPLHALIDGFQWTQNRDALASHLWVDDYTLDVRLDALDPIEVAELEHGTGGAWWQH